MEISVIIPVYNAERFVRRAVRSALEQPEVTEVVLLEDGSPDSSYEVCQSLADEHFNVVLYTHPNRENRGAGATRNRAIRESSNEFIAFLDADDFFLSGRFARTAEVFEKHPDADGVYEAVGVHFETDKAKERWVKRGGGKPITTMKNRVSPEQLFWKQSPVGGEGYGHTSGWTVRRRAFDKAGYFNPSLRLHQDTDLFVRFAMACRMYPGELDEPVAMRGVHDQNRITRRRTPGEALVHRLKMWTEICGWALQRGYTPEAKEATKCLGVTSLRRVKNNPKVLTEYDVWIQIHNTIKKLAQSISA